MSNELLLFATILAAFCGLLLFYRIWGKTGLYAWAAFATIVANIEVLKCVDLFGLSVTLGNVIYASTFLCTDILHENHSAKEARRAVWIGFASTIIVVILGQLTLAFKPNEIDLSQGALQVVFGFMPRMAAASLFSYLFSNMLDTYLYGFISKKTKRVWLRNNGSTLVSQAVDTALVTPLMFAGLMPVNELWQVGITTYLIKVIVALCDTPFIYISKRIYTKYNETINNNN